MFRELCLKLQIEFDQGTHPVLGCWELGIPGRENSIFWPWNNDFPIS